MAGLATDGFSMDSRLLRTATAVIVLFTAAFIVAEEPKCHVPATECERQIRQMLSGRRYLGLEVVDLKPGLVVKTVRPESPASRADFKEGDRLIAINGKSMEQATAKQFKEALAEARSTGRLWIIVQRRGAYQKIETRLEPYPEEYIEKVISAHIAQAHTASNGTGQ
ncbi:MAG TPA: PDZ domain-containing protein [Thermoanaerobaculia bacterium]|nr:PDZ domain-containing protein [Thermoanaerobaculia bacterium]